MADAEEQYYIRLRGKTRGPYSIEQLRRMVPRGQFSKLHQVSQDRTTWESARALETVFPTVPQPANNKPSESAPEPAIWFYAFEEKKLGPVTESELRNHISLGNVTDSTLVWREGMEEWENAGRYFRVQGSRSGTRKAIWLTAAVVLITLTAGALGTWYLRMDQRTIEAVFSPGEIHSMNLKDPSVNEQVSSATGMVISYIEILRKTGERHEQAFGHGTGFVVTRDGLMLTNRHVVEDHQVWSDASQEGRVERLIRYNNEAIDKLVDGSYDKQQWKSSCRDYCTEEIQSITPYLKVYFVDKSFSADIRYQSKKYDMAVLHLNSFIDNGVFFALSDESDAPRTTRVVALGYPGVSLRPISEDEQALASANRTPSSLAELFFGPEDHRDSFKSSAFNFVSTPGEISVVQEESGGMYNAQHTAAIRPGNSGGPLVLRDDKFAGVVFGINTLYLKDDSPVFVAFPVNQMRKELEEEAEIKGLRWR